MQHTLQNYAVEVVNNALKYTGIKQIDLARKMQFSAQRISNYFSGKSEFTLDILDAFCIALNIPTAKIFENYDRLEVPERIVDEIKGIIPGKKAA